MPSSTSVPDAPAASGPSTYEWRGRGGPFELQLGPKTFAPTRTSMEVAEELRVSPGDTVFDIGCGSGVLAIVAAMLGAGRVYGTEVNEEAVRYARRNAEALGVGDRVEFHHGSLYEPLGDLRADIVIGDVAGIPDSIAAETGWYPGGYSGGPTGAEVPVAMLQATFKHLLPGGRLYLPTGSIQDEGAVLRAARAIFGESRMRQLRERLFPLPTKVSDSVVMRKLMESGVVSLIRKGSRLLWALRVWECEAPPLAAP
jgi:SAM-dependent methyltransferase